MSAPFSPAARTRTSTSPLPGSGYGCCSTRTSPSRIVAARIGASLSRCAGGRGRGPVGALAPRRVLALQQRDALDVVRLGKHVDGLHAPQRVAGLDEFGGVGRERGGVAGDVDDAPGGRFHDAVYD